MYKQSNQLNNQTTKQPGNTNVFLFIDILLLFIDILLLFIDVLSYLSCLYIH